VLIAIDGGHGRPDTYCSREPLDDAEKHRSKNFVL
jgi:hypothetical protein